MRKLLLFLIYFAISYALTAQSLQDTTALKEVILQSTPVRQPGFKSPASVSVIQAEAIGRTDGVILTPLLNTIPGVLMQQGNLNTNRITIRGVGARTPFGTSRIKAYLNDIPLSSAEGETILEDIDAEWLHQLEILKGPNATAFGAGTGGVIAFHTSIPDDELTQISTQSQWGSFGLWRYGIQALHRDSLTGMRLGYARQEADGFRQNSAYERDQLFLHLDHATDPKGILSVLALATRVKAFIPSSINRTDFENNPEVAAANWLNAQGYEAYQRMILGLSYQRNFSEQWEGRISVFQQYRIGDEPRPFDILLEKTQNIGLRAVLNHTTRWWDRKSTLSFGTEIMQEQYRFNLLRNLYLQQPGMGSVRGDWFNGGQQQRSYVHLFGQWEWEWSERWRIESGVAINQTRYNLETPDLQKESFDYGTVILPRVGLSYILHPQHVLYGSWSTGFSVPTVSESLTVEGNFNPTLLPEKAHSFEIGYKTRTLTGKWMGSLVLYHMPVNDLLVARRIAEDQYEGRNAGKSRHQGVELEGRYRWDISKTLQLYSFLTGSWNRFRFIDFTDFDVTHDDNKLPAVPDHQIASGLTLQTAFGWETTLQYRYLGEVALNDANSLFAPGYGLLDIHSAYHHKLGKHWYIRLQAGINNTTNQAYAASVLPNAVGFGNTKPRYFYPGAPVNYYGGIRVRFEW
ncbi:MAG: TonB-dependent receptor family protein [Flavobacterium sp.]